MSRTKGVSRLFIGLIFAGVVAGLVAAPAATAAPAACTSSFSRDVNSYVLFAYSDMIYKGAAPGSPAVGGTIDGGNVGVNADNGSSASELSFTGETTLTNTSQQVVADKIANDDDDSVFYDFYSNAVDGTFDDSVIYGCQAKATEMAQFGGLPIITSTQDFDAFTHNSGPYNPVVPAFNVGAGDFEVAAGATQNLSPGEYKELRVNDDGILNLTNGIYTFESISVGKRTQINTLDGTEVRVAEGITLQDDAKVQGSNSAKFIIRGDGNDVTIFSHGAEVHGQFFSLGHIDLGGRGNLFGRFWADKITGDPGNNVTYDCGPAPDEDANCKKTPPPCVPGPGEDENCNPITPPCVPGPGQDANCQPIVTPSCVPKAGQDKNCNPIPSATDSAKLRGPKGCTTSYNVRVSGTNISKVVYKIDGKRVKTVKKSPFTYKLRSYKYKVGAHKLKATTYFKSGKRKTQTVTFQRCGKSAVSPKFTG